MLVPVASSVNESWCALRAEITVIPIEGCVRLGISAPEDIAVYRRRSGSYSAKKRTPAPGKMREER